MNANIEKHVIFVEGMGFMVGVGGNRAMFTNSINKAESFRSESSALDFIQDVALTSLDFQIIKVIL